MNNYKKLVWTALFAAAPAGLLGCSDDSRGTPARCDETNSCSADDDGGTPPRASDADSVAMRDAAIRSDGAAESDASDDAGSFVSGPIRPTRLRISEPVNAALPCEAAGSGSIRAYEVLAGQTHLTPASWPLQTVSANRPLTIAVSAEGTGAAPSFVATARLADKTLAICLTGPSTLPGDRVDLETSTYRGSLPSSWVQPGLQVDVTFDGRSETLRPDIKADNGLTLYLVHAQLFGEGTVKQTSGEQLRELLARLPVSYLDVGTDPFGVWRPSKLLLGPRDDGQTKNGTTTKQPAMVVDELPHCTTQDKTSGSCTPHSGYGTMSAVLNALDTFRAANGVARTSTWYAELTVPLGGGLAGGQRGTGDNTRLVMNHELGHAWGFPHWDATHTDYPYEGVQRANGGFGDRWALDQQTNLLLGPRCEDKERQSPMQRAGSCVPKGSWFDPYSDYEAARLLRMTLGASAEVTGSVPYAGGSRAAATRTFRLPKEDGRPRMVWNTTGPGMTLERYDEQSNAYVAYAPDEWNRIAEAEVPVMMFAGGVIVGGASFFEPPVEYVGNVLAALDPSRAEDYAYLYAHRSSDFYWARDLSLRFTLDDGSVFSRLYGAEAVLRADGHYTGFALNLPVALGRRVIKLETLARPLGQYAMESRLDASDSATNYFDDARVLATWQR